MEREECTTLPNDTLSSKGFNILSCYLLPKKAFLKYRNWKTNYELIKKIIYFVEYQNVSIRFQAQETFIQYHVYEFSISKFDSFMKQ